ncbi:MAG: crossover junction endodeoxyribonuclease RuvC [Candidatus Binatia bacterium]
MLGIDPGSVVTGWGLVEFEGNQLRHVANGIIGASTALGQAERLRQIHYGIEEIIKQYRPGAVSLEKVFFSRNAQSALKLGQARGMAMLAAAQNQIDVLEYSATEIKVAVVGYGHASKEQIQKMVSALLGLRGSLRADAADALAAAICHIHRRTYQTRIAVSRATKASWRDYPKIVSKR